MIRNQTAVLALAAPLLLASCNASFDVEVSSKTTIKGGSLFQNLVADAFGDFSSIDLSQASDFKNAGVRKEDIDSVKLKSLTLRIVSPAGATFEFLDAIEFYAETDGQPKVKVASKAAIPNDATTVTLDVEDVELAPYVTAPKMSLTTDANAHAPRQDTQIEAIAIFDVDPRIL